MAFAAARMIKEKKEQEQMKKLNESKVLANKYLESGDGILSNTYSWFICPN